MKSPAYQDGGLIVVNFDEGFPPYTNYGNSIADKDYQPTTPLGTDSLTGRSAISEANTAQSVVACCNELHGPNTTQPGFQAFNQDTTPGGGITGAVLMSPYITPGSVTDQPYNHFSWLRSMEDLFGIHTGWTDGLGHLGYAAADGLRPFGPDVYNNPSAKVLPAKPSGRGGLYAAQASLSRQRPAGLLRAHRRGSVTWSLLRAVPVLLALVLTGTACSSVPHPEGAPHAGSYPVATPGDEVRATPRADDATYRLVSAGDTVQADVGAVRLLALAAGPELTIPPGPPASHVGGVLTVTLRSQQGTATLPTSSFLLLDEGQQPIAYTADAPSVTVAPGVPAVVHLTADLPAGHATLTWQPTGHPMVTWDFVVEVD